MDLSRQILKRVAFDSCRQREKKDINRLREVDVEAEVYKGTGATVNLVLLLELLVFITVGDQKHV